MNDQNHKPPETWNDEKTMEADMNLLMVSQYIKYDDKVVQAFRIGWKAGAREATVRMWHWIQKEIFGHEEPKKKEGDKG